MKEQELSKKEKENSKKVITKEITDKIILDIKNDIHNYTEEVKEDLKEDILDDVNNEISNLVKREEKRMLNNKKIAIFKRDIIIIILFAIGLYFGYCLYDAKYFNFMKSECEKEGNCNQVENNQDSGDTSSENNEPLIIKDKKWYIDNFGYLLNKAKLTMNADNVSAYYLYSTDRKMSDVKSSVLLNMAYKNLNSKSIKSNSVSITVEGNDLKNAFQDLFGTFANYKPGNFTYNCLHFKYNQEKDRYSAENTKCAIANNKIIEEIDDMYEEGNVLYIITNATIYNESESSYYSFDNLYEPLFTDVTDADLSTYARRLNRYQYQFKKEEESYYLDSIIKLK